MSRPRPWLVWQAGVSFDDVAGTDRHLTEALVAGFDVELLWVDPPVSVTRAVRRRLRPTVGPQSVPGTERTSRLTVWAPPFAHRPGIDRLTMTGLRETLRHTLRRSGRQVAAVVSTSPYPQLRVAPGARRVYFATDDYVAGASLMGKSAARITQLERQRIAEADLLVAVSPEIAARWPDRAVTLLPNGCRVAPLRPPTPDGAGLPRPVAGVVGQISPRIDLGLLEAVADAGISLLLVGPVRPGTDIDRFDRLTSRPTVSWTGARRYDELPGLFAAMDVGLTPYVDDAFNRASFPLKTLEYLAAGLPVVSTDLPATRRLGTDLVVAAADPTAFVAGVRAVTAEDAESLRRRRHTFAGQHSWSRRAADLGAALGLTPLPRPDDRPVDVSP